jgi:hypothetical protein
MLLVFSFWKTVTVFFFQCHTVRFILQTFVLRLVKKVARSYLRRRAAGCCLHLLSVPSLESLEVLLIILTEKGRWETQIYQTRDRVPCTRILSDTVLFCFWIFSGFFAPKMSGSLATSEVGSYATYREGPFSLHFTWASSSCVSVSYQVLQQQ